MKTKQLAGFILLVVGVALLLISLLADAVGLGVNPIFGTRQIITLVVGAVAAIAGVALLLIKGKSKAQPQD